MRKNYSILSKAALITALDRFNANAGDKGVAFDPDFHIHALQMFGIPCREARPVSWRSAGRTVAGINELADILRQSGMPSFRRVLLVGVTPGNIPRTGTSCAVLDFSEDGQLAHFSPDPEVEPVEMPLGEAIDAAVDLFLERFGGEVQA
ncbi:hypothetical protein [Aeromonas caviae]|uniref:hypothetical protein n=1 Tax=Aeromonas caviae TaxID=648 RepID=UPI003CEFF7A9